MRFGLISDTHSFLDPKLFEYFKDCDEVWHAGDWGSPDVALALEKKFRLRGVYGNIDGQEIRKRFPEVQLFRVGKFKVLITHIGGYPGHYPPPVRALLWEHRPDIFICGHSHILRVMRDKSYGKMLYLNSGAAGKEGFHKVRTVIRFEITADSQLQNMEVVELGPRTEIVQG